MTGRYWRIRGYNSLTEFFDVSIPTGSLNERRLGDLLQCLTAKASLTYTEIIGAYVKRKTKRAHDMLQVQKHGLYPEYSCGSNPHFTAIVVDKNGKRANHPPPLE